MTTAELQRLEAELEAQVRIAHHNARIVLKATVDNPDAVDAASSAMQALSKAMALREAIDELRAMGEESQ